MKKKKQNYLGLSLFVLIFASCAPKSETKIEEEEEIITASSSAASRWPLNKLPLNLKISTAYSADEKTALQNMVNIWNGADSLNYFQSLSDTANLEHTSNLDAYEDGTNGIYILNTWPSSLPTTALAITQAFGMASKNSITITEADIMLNEANFAFSVNGSPANGYDLSTVMLHEMGHFLGMPHSSFSSSSSVMAPTITSSTVNQSLYSNDVYTLIGLYSSVASLNEDASNNLNDFTQAKKVKVIQFLMSDGECHHYVDDKFSFKHQTNIK